MTLRDQQGNETGNTLEAGRDLLGLRSDNPHPPLSKSSSAIRLRHVPDTVNATEDLSGCGGTLSALVASHAMPSSSRSSSIQGVERQTLIMVSIA
jgi:hypothetical protein